MKQSWRERAVIYGLLGFGALVLALPFYTMVVTSLKSMTEIAEPGLNLGLKRPTLEAYGLLFEADLVTRATLNSLIVALISTIGSMFVCSLAGYAFAKHRFPGRNALFVLLLSTMMIPGAVLMVPGFLLFRNLGWLDTWLPLIVPGLGGAFGVFLSRQFMQRIPDSIVESAKLEGVGEFGIYVRLIVPLSGPLLATLGILTFLGSWNSFMGPLIVLLDERKYTLPLVIAMLQGRFPGRDNVQMAGAMISILPVLVLFFILQKQIVASLAHSGLKEG